MNELLHDREPRRRLNAGIDPNSAEQFVAELLRLRFVRRKYAHHDECVGPKSTTCFHDLV
jgi:hypothetical protein